MNSGQNLNKELYSGLFRPDRFKLYSRLLDVHGNVLSSGISWFTGLDYVIIPTSVPRMYADFYEFPHHMSFESDLTVGSL